MLWTFIIDGVGPGGGSEQPQRYKCNPNHADIYALSWVILFLGFLPVPALEIVLGVQVNVHIDPNQDGQDGHGH